MLGSAGPEVVSDLCPWHGKKNEEIASYSKGRPQTWWFVGSGGSNEVTRKAEQRNWNVLIVLLLSKGKARAHPPSIAHASNHRPPCSSGG